ncbi:Astacin (Peptidase family M12A) [Marinobacter daqiaonensis]|uniref:Astacin (Peptidase family M12A) n=1 Tax=Marinobacter daqiaonensis TaxID=650891 RepID=A0A1I6H0Q2_9GAMM|nr:Astacin (Peptidase family M12A) [Marinobacter daqiaonensis]
MEKRSSRATSSWVTRMRSTTGPAARSSPRGNPRKATTSLRPRNWQRWTTRVYCCREAMFYDFAANLSSGIRSNVSDAAQRLTNSTNLRLLQRRSSADDYILISQGSGCSWELGRQGGEQDMTLEGGCTDGIMHEFLHAAGVWHEQSRTDRDKHVSVFLNRGGERQGAQFRNPSGQRMARPLRLRLHHALRPKGLRQGWLLRHLLHHDQPQGVTAIRRYHGPTFRTGRQRSRRDSPALSGSARISLQSWVGRPVPRDGGGLR